MRISVSDGVAQGTCPVCGHEKPARERLRGLFFREGDAPTITEATIALGVSQSLLYKIAAEEGLAFSKQRTRKVASGHEA